MDRRAASGHGRQRTLEKDRAAVGVNGRQSNRGVDATKAARRAAHPIVTLPAAAAGMEAGGRASVCASIKRLETRLTEGKKVIMRRSKGEGGCGEGGRAGGRVMGGREDEWGTR